MRKSDQNPCRKQNNISTRMYYRADVTTCKFPEQNHVWHPLREVRILQEGTDSLGISNLPATTSSPQVLLCIWRRGIATLYYATCTWKKLEFEVQRVWVYFFSLLYFFLSYFFFPLSSTFSSPLLFSLSFDFFPLHFSLVVFQPNCRISHLGMQSVSPHLFSTLALPWKLVPSVTRRDRSNSEWRKKKKIPFFYSKMKPVSMGRWRKILDVIRSNCVLTLHRIISPIIEN